MMIYEMSVDTTNNISMTMSVVVRSGHLVAIMVMVMATIVAMEAIPMIRLLIIYDTYNNLIEKEVIYQQKSLSSFSRSLREVRE